MPEPLQIPVKRTLPWESCTVVVTAFGTKSVVKIARAKLSATSVARSTNSGTAGDDFFTSRDACRSLPVLAARTCAGLDCQAWRPQPGPCARLFATPYVPVAALAWPELVIKARICAEGRSS